MRELQLVRRAGPSAEACHSNGACRSESGLLRQHVAACEHRAVSRDGRIICEKIVDGDREVSPNICRDCPYKQVNCAHLRFSLRLHCPSPLVVRHNGRTEVWDDGPPQLALQRAACSERVMPIHGPRACESCPMRQPLRDATAEHRPRPAPLVGGKVVSFPAREALAAAG